jgi:choline kinase
MDLVIMAAGRGTRFGGLKQLCPVGVNGEFIIDYNIYDAIKAGFKRIIIIIKKEHQELFEKTLNKRIKKIPIIYVYQTSELNGMNRIKPWGTAHALYMVKNVVSDKFALINGDNWYGEDCFIKLYDTLINNKENNINVIGYEIIKTLMNDKEVKRGVIFRENNQDIINESLVYKSNGYLYAKDLKNKEEVKVDKNALVSTNAWAFNKRIFSLLEKYMHDFKVNTLDISNDEFMLPDVISKIVLNDNFILNVVKSNADWYEITYPEDADYIRIKIKEKIKNGIYPLNLW